MILYLPSHGWLADRSLLNVGHFVQYWTFVYNTEHCVQYCTLVYNTVHWFTLLYICLQYCTLVYSIVQCWTVVWSVVIYSGVKNCDGVYLREAIKGIFFKFFKRGEVSDLNTNLCIHFFVCFSLVRTMENRKGLSEKTCQRDLPWPWLFFQTFVFK